MATVDSTNTSIGLTRQAGVGYPAPPYGPARLYPELGRLPYRVEAQGSPATDVYTGVRTALELLGMDAENAGKPTWNPFRRMVQPGQSTVIKPNLVFDQHPLGAEGVSCMVTHASVLRPLVDYVLLATGGNGRITICDVPLQSADWDILVERGGYRALVEFYTGVGIEIELADYRKEIAVRNRDNVIIRRIHHEGDRRGYTAVDLGSASAFYPVIDKCKRFRITDYPGRTVSQHHNAVRNEYLIPNTILLSDFFINVPKLKTHRKAGISCAMKNLVGINGDKSWIAHHTAGRRSRGGDEYASFRPREYLVWHGWEFLKSHAATRWMTPLIKRLYYRCVTRGRTIEEMTLRGDIESQMEGSWYGNDTLWRCIADLNQVILCADTAGHIQPSPQRRYLAVVDAVIAGEGEGPLQNTPKSCGVILAGLNPLSVDATAASLMGFDTTRIPSITRTREMQHFAYVPSGCLEPQVKGERFADPFKPNQTWKGHVESAKTSA
jgi:uncharacterized protein (DUF362 family)